ncbi:hypothetical protein O1611_g6578 [Lasiodiplodia mahajangana]|uniref:Uncharacterized protein n=1 Tax=Lasiodiplodia mahajangana TaxID=1108764 RepID=A0ACC2JIP8_9PEZI|nr:hypothetical protein O1611_g6578 [Lasiodiplodia mahajangana]
MENISETTTDCSAADRMRSLISIMSGIVSEVTLAPCDSVQELEQDGTNKIGSSEINNVETLPVPSADDTTANQTNSEEYLLRETNAAVNLEFSSDTQLPKTRDAEDGLDKESSLVVNSDSRASSRVADTTEITPFPYTVGKVLELKAPEGKQLFATITKVYPVSMSPVLVVRLDDWNGSREVVLKLYDRRFGNHRKECQMDDDPPEPHTAQAEVAWQRYVREGLAEPLLQAIQDGHDNWNDYGDDSEDEDDSKVNDKPLWQTLGEQEGRHYYDLMDDYTTEVRAYKELQELQGRCIPRLFSTVVFDMPSAQEDLPATYFQVTGILIEKIDGFRLSDLLANTPKESPSLWKEIIEDTMECSAEVNRRGVIHGDSAPRNVIVSSSGGNGYQPFLVDFAMASFESEYKDECIAGTDEYYDNGAICYCWSCRVRMNDDAAAVGGDMRSAVMIATGHTLEFRYPANRFPARPETAAPIVELDH